MLFAVLQQEQFVVRDLQLDWAERLLVVRHQAGLDAVQTILRVQRDSVHHLADIFFHVVILHALIALFLMHFLDMVLHFVPLWMGIINLLFTVGCGVGGLRGRLWVEVLRDE